MNAIMSFYFLFQIYEQLYIISKNMKNDIKPASLKAIHATHVSHEASNKLEVKCSTLIKLHLLHTQEWATINNTLKHGTSTVIKTIKSEWALLHITTALLNHIRPNMFINWKWAQIRITSVQFVKANVKPID